MKLQFRYSKKREQKILLDVYDEYQWYIDYNFPVVLPKFFKKLYANKRGDKKAFTKELNKQLGNIYHKDVYRKKISKARKNWRKQEKQFFQIMEALGFKARQKYYCYATLYGPQGQFLYPDSLDIRMSTTQDIKDSSATIAHELVHLFLYKKTHAMKLGYEKTEGVVDLFFTETGLKQLFPYHGLQTTASHDMKIFKKFATSKNKRAD